MTTATQTDDDGNSREVAVNDFIARLGRRVLKARQTQSISRRVLSQKSGVSQRYLAQLEAGTGNVSLALLYRIAMALGHPPEKLLGEADPWDTDLASFSELYLRANTTQRARARSVLSNQNPTQGKDHRICLIGLRGAGKSTLGHWLAERMALEFIELNTVIEEQCGVAIGEVIALYGQEGYRKLERQAMESVAKNNDSVILAAAGGIVSDPETYGLLLQSFHTIWLQASPEEHMDRVRQQGDERPMADNPRAMDELRSILSSRDNLYARADLQVDTSGRTVEQSRLDLIDAVRRVPRP